jgi:nitrate/nitrite-specific signal transduction histidine kinase
VTVGTRPILSFTRVAEAVGEGEYDQDFSTIKQTRFPDEITKLVTVFSTMVGKVAEREASLKHQVEELTIEIDQVKKEKEVEKIVESDSFRDLQEKARTMRARRRS